MNRFLLDTESVNALEQWEINNPGYVFAASPYFKKFEVHIDIDEGQCIVYSELTDTKIKLSIKFDRKKLYAVIVGYRQGTDISFDVSMRNEYPYLPTTPEFANNILNMVLTANAVLTYGNIVDDNTVRLQGHNDGKDKVIVFRAYEEKIYALSTGSHRSPEGVFNVRGHFRKYKSGKIVWIDEYWKGLTDKEKP